MSLFLTKCLFHTPPAFKSVAERGPVNSKLICPTEKRLGFSAKGQLPCRWLWWGTKGFFSCPPCIKSLVKSASGHAERGSPLGNRHCFAVKFKFLSLGWWKQKIVFVPVSINTVGKGACGNFRFFRPIANALYVVSNCNSPGPASVPCLLPMCLPAAILRFVVAVVVDPANGRFRKWLWSHIFKEVFKRLKPPGTNGYPSSAIVHIARLVFVVASFNHATPSAVFRSSRSPVSGVAKNCFLPSSASAITRLGISQVFSTNHLSSSALAFAQPRCLSVGRKASILNYRPFPVRVARQVFNAGWNSNRIICSHDASLISRVVRVAQRVMTVGLLAFYHEPSGKWR